PFLRQPSVQYLDDALAQCGGFHDTAVEEDVRGAGEAARTAADGSAGVRFAGLASEKASQMFRDGGVGGGRKAEVPKADAPLTRRHLTGLHRGEESFPQHMIDVVDGQGRLDRSADDA